ncbi:MAG: ATP-binding protein [Nanoarchaeota archaeon]|nr:ATP-binding protein [Nanoarchaeota archaeon]
MEKESDEEKRYRFFPLLPGDNPKKDDVVGEAGNFIENLELNIENAGMFKIMGTNPEKTFLISGPPGVGKTYGIQALNNHMNKRIKKDLFSQDSKIDLSELGVLCYPYDIGRYGTAFINRGSRIVQAFFDNCFYMASKGINVLAYMDEVDALLSDRKNQFQSHKEDAKVLETIMKNMQIAHDTDNMYVVLMTNLEEMCDKAAIRAGRIDARIELKLPIDEERRFSFVKAIKKVNKNAGYKVIRGANIDNLVEMSNNFSYADIFQVVENSVKKRVKELIISDRRIVQNCYVAGKRLEDGLKEHAISFKLKESRKIGFCR